MVYATFWAAILTAMIRHISGHVPVLQMVFFRNFFALLFMLPWLREFGVGALYIKSNGLHFFRALSGIMGMILWFWGVSVFPLNEAVALSFMVPLFTVVMAHYVLKEHIGWHRRIALCIGFLGTLFILRPGSAGFRVEAFIILGSALTWAISNILIKRLVHMHDPKVIVLSVTFLITPVSFLLAIFFWEPVSFKMIVWLVLLGWVSNIGQLTLARAYASAELSLLVSFDFLRLVFIAVIAYLVYDEMLDIWTMVGSGIIVASTFYLAHREARAKRAAAVLAEQGPVLSQ